MFLSLPLGARTTLIINSILFSIIIIIWVFQDTLLYTNEHIGVYPYIPAQSLADP